MLGGWRIGLHYSSPHLCLHRYCPYFLRVEPKADSRSVGKSNPILSSLYQKSNPAQTSLSCYPIAPLCPSKKPSASLFLYYFTDCSNKYHTYAQASTSAYSTEPYLTLHYLTEKSVSAYQVRAAPTQPPTCLLERCAAKGTVETVATLICSVWNKQHEP